MFSSIAMVGAGATGGYYGARLALAGRDVRFLVRPNRCIALRQSGLTLRERDGTRHLQPVAAFAAAEELGAVDLVFVTLKSTANDHLARLLSPLLHRTTAVVTLQNGIGNEEFIASLVGAERLLGGLCYIGVTRTGPAEITGYHTPGGITLGEFGRPAGERTQAIAALLGVAGMKLRVADNLAEARWQKLIWNIPFNGLAIARGGITTDRILGDPAIAAEVRPLMDEIAAAGRALGFDVPEELIRSQLAMTPPMGAYAPSSLVDHLAGREVEVEAIWGEPLRRARAAGLAMPRLAGLYAELRAVTKT